MQSVNNLQEEWVSKKPSSAQRIFWPVCLMEPHLCHALKCFLIPGFHTDTRFPCESFDPACFAHGILPEVLTSVILPESVTSVRLLFFCFVYPWLSPDAIMLPQSWHCAGTSWLSRLRDLQAWSGCRAGSLLSVLQCPGCQTPGKDVTPPPHSEEPRNPTPYSAAGVMGF